MQTEGKRLSGAILALCTVVYLAIGPYIMQASLGTDAVRAWIFFGFVLMVLGSPPVNKVSMPTW
ncbi:hypothetical protein KKH15_03260 [Patescibacteria group bacterium]|nr:hypothetical protein [Patescibacteria group bacterium]MBU1755050.1 hypothetical protein [Patescibacteria group bacterium]